MSRVDFETIFGSGRHFSFEVLPPLKGSGTESLFRTIDKLKEFEPVFINITTHHSEYVYRELPNGQFERLRLRRRPGTIAIAAAIQQKFNIPVVPHVICSGATVFIPTAGGHAHTTDLIEQVNRFNEGFFADGSPIKSPGVKFSYGVACYPEKHEEAPNIDVDMQYLLIKQQLGASYAVTQLFYDNQKYYDFVDKARKIGVTIPIIPGLKPMAKLSQLTVVPRSFHCDIPNELAQEAMKCKTDEDAKRLGIEWTLNQCRDLYAHGVNNIHFYTMSAVDSVKEVMERLG